MPKMSRLLRKQRAWVAADQRGLRLLWWPRKRRVAGRRHHLERFMALPLGALEVAYRRAKEIERVDPAGARAFYAAALEAERERRELRRVDL